MTEVRQVWSDLKPDTKFGMNLYDPLVAPAVETVIPMRGASLIPPPADMSHLFSGGGAASVQFNKPLFAPGGGGDDWITIRISEYNDLLFSKQRTEQLLSIIDDLERTYNKSDTELMVAKERRERECTELKAKCGHAVLSHAREMKVRFDDMFKQHSADIVKQREQHTQAMTKAADQYVYSTMMLKREITS